MYKLVNTREDRIELPWGQYTYSIEPGQVMEFTGDVATAIYERFPGVKFYSDPVVTEVPVVEEPKEEKPKRKKVANETEAV